MSTHNSIPSRNQGPDSQYHERTVESTSSIQNNETHDIRRGFMGTSSRLFNNSSVINHSSSQMNTNLSVMSENDQETVAVLWGTNFDVQEVERKIREFVRNFTIKRTDSGGMEIEGDYRYADTDEELKDKLYMWNLHQVKETDQFHVNVDAHHIHQFDRQLYSQLIYYPAETILYFDRVLNDIYRDSILDTDEQRSDFQNNILTRVSNLKHKSRLRDLNPRDINHLISIQGIVIRVSDIYPEMKDAHFKCTVCSHKLTTNIDRGRVNEPTICPKCGSKHSFELIHNLCMFTDKQYVKMQETPDTVPEGETPQNVSLIVYDDMVDGCKPGDKVEITGIYRAQGIRASRFKRTLRSVFKTYVDVVCISSMQKDKLYLGDGDKAGEDHEVKFSQEEIRHFKDLSENPDVYDILTNSLAPSIWENTDVKKGVLCQMFGGTPKHFGEDLRGRFRSDVNILLVGDPSTAKSQMLQFVHKLAPRGIYTSGKGSSAVGLTAYVTKDPETGEVILESGALVLSDKGICCIDEFDKMDDNTKTILHEAMEQQTISIAKNGIVCSLNSRTAVLAAANPKESRYNPRKSIVYNIKLPPTLLSRFDLIYLMLDKPNEKHDSKLAAHILTLYSPEYAQNPRTYQGNIIDRNIFTKYISYARIYCQPKITDEVVDDMVSGYVQMRKMGNNKNVITATPRQLESIIRLSEALAKMRLSNEVERKDVAEAERLIRVATQQAAINPLTGQIDMDLIQTGYTSGIRSKLAIIAEIVKDLMRTQPEAFKKGVRGYQLLKDVLAKSENKVESINNQELTEALRNLEDENKIVFFGNTNDDKYTVKAVEF